MTEPQEIKNREIFNKVRESHKESHIQKYQPNNQKHQPDIQEHQPDNQEHQPDIQEHQPNNQKHQPNNQKYQPDIQEHQPDNQKHQPDNQKSHIQKYQPDNQKHQPDNQKSDIQEMEDKIRKFCEERDWDSYHNAKDLAIGIITEASELLEHFRFVPESQVPKHFIEKRSEIEDEVADIFFVLLRFCQKYEINAKKALDSKIKKIAKKYPLDLG